MIVERPEFISWLAAWVACMVIVLWGQRKMGSGAGLVISYVLQLWFTHWLAASIYALPWFVRPDSTLLYGLEQSTFAIAGFAIGSTFIAPWLFRDRSGDDFEHADRVPTDSRLVRTYLIVGVVSYFVLDPILHSVPTAGAIVSTAANMLLVALGLECWNALSTTRRSGSFLQWVLLSATLPFVTILTKGFLSYGFAAMLTVFSFVASFYRPRWKMLAFSVLVGYLALSMYVTYMRDRRDIREVVWRQEAYSSRFTTILNTLANFEFIDLQNNDHLARIDDRLNQNALVGFAVAYLDTHPDRFASGRTVRDALLSPIPRILWPDRPIAAGSGNLVSEFTGLRFSEDTSVGIGHVLEWYVNFGAVGVFLGMLLTGMIVGWFDRRAVLQLYHGDPARFVLWWLPGLNLLQVGGSLVEAVSGATTAVAVAVLIYRFGGFSQRYVGHGRAPALAPVSGHASD